MQAFIIRSYLIRSKMAESNKIEKTEELIAGYQEEECLWNVLSLSQVQKQKLKANRFNKCKPKAKNLILMSGIYCETGLL